MKSYLVQRASIRTTNRELTKGVDSLLRYDYMGSAEFEFGSLGASFRRILADLDDYAVFDTELSPDKKRPLFLTCKASQHGEIIKELKEIIDGRRRLKEISYLKEVLDGTTRCAERIDVRWDIDNDWIAHLSDKTNKDIVLFALREAAKNRKEKKE